MVRIGENGGRRATCPDFFENLAVGSLRKAAAAVLLRRGHSKNAGPGQALDYVRRNIGIAIDCYRIQLTVEKIANLGERLVQLSLEAM